jgi:hypothetical protein
LRTHEPVAENIRTSPGLTRTDPGIDLYRYHPRTPARAKLRRRSARNRAFLGLARFSAGPSLVRASLCIPPLNKQLGWLPGSIDATARGAVM